MELCARCHPMQGRRKEIAVGSSTVTFEDSALIQRALAGQTESFEVLISRHLPAVRARVRLMTPNTADVEDILQEILLKVWRHLSTFHSQSSFRTWITRVAINEVLQSHRRRQSRPICQTLGDSDAFAVFQRIAAPGSRSNRNDAGRSRSNC